MNNVTLVGRITKDPELRYIPGSGTAVANFTIAIDREYKKKDGTKETDFIPIEVMGKSAEFCANFLSKGRLVALTGSIRVENYQDQQGNKKTFTKVNTRAVQALDKNPNQQNNNGNQNYQNQGRNTQQNSVPDTSFQTIDDDDIPF